MNGVNSSSSMERLQTRKRNIVKTIKHELGIRPKEYIRVPRMMDYVNHSRTRPVPTNKYLTQGRKVSTVRDVCAEKSPFKISDKIDMSSFHMKKERVPWTKGPGYTRPTFRSAVMQDILARVQIPDDDLKPLPSKLDLDKEFYTMASGRPLYGWHFWRKEQYLKGINKIFLRRFLAGFSEDLLRQKEEKSLLELWYVNSVKERTRPVIKSFEQFLFDEYEDGQVILDQSDELQKIVERKQEDLAQAKTILETISTHITQMHEVLQYRKDCKNVLHRISPPYWKGAYEKEKQRLQPVAELATEKLLSYYAEYRLVTPEEDKYLMNIIERLAGDMLSLGPPALAFSQPWQVDQIMKQMENQNLNSLLARRDVKKQRDKMESMKALTKKFHEKERVMIDKVIKDIEKNIKYQEERAAELEKRRLDIIHNKFKPYVSFDEALEVQMLTLRLFEDIFGPNEQNLAPAQMLISIEKAMIDTWDALNDIPKNIRQALESEVDEEKRKSMREAETAEIRLKQLTTTLERMKGVRHPTPGRQGRQPFRRSRPVPRKPLRPIKKEPVKPTRVELQVPSEMLKEEEEKEEQRRRREAVLKTLTEDERLVKESTAGPEEVEVEEEEVEVRREEKSEGELETTGRVTRDQMEDFYGGYFHYPDTDMDHDSFLDNKVPEEEDRDKEKDQLIQNTVSAAMHGKKMKNKK